MNERQRKFAAEYLKDMNATQAAIRAGYSERTAYATGHRLLRHHEVSALVQRGVAKALRKAEMTRDEVIDELSRIARFDLRKVVQIKGGAVRVRESDEWDDETASAVSEVAETRFGLKVKAHDKLGALRVLAQYFGLLTEVHEHRVINLGQLTEPQLKRLAAGEKLEAVLQES